MEITMKTVQKVQRAFNEAWVRIHTGNRPVGVSCSPDYHPDDNEFWTMYMNYLDCILVTKDDLMEEFPEMVNFGFAVNYPRLKPWACHSNSRQPLNGCLADDYRLIDAAL